MTTVPLPGGYADKLILHLDTCPQCRLAKINPRERKCPEGQALIRSTIEERHEGRSQ